MGQKNNIITLRKNFREALGNPQPKNCSKTLIFLEHINCLYKKRGFFITESFIFYIENKVYISLTGIYLTGKMNILKRIKGIKTDKKFNSYTPLATLSKYFKANIINTKITVLNKKINKSLLIFFYKNFKKYVISLFDKNFNLFIDFIKILSLLFENKIGVKPLIYIFSKIFSILHKKKHNLYINFIKNVFQVLTTETKDFIPIITGIKFVVSGKLMGKTRSSTQSIQVGNVPTQTLAKSIDFTMRHVFTSYGTFGLKIWINKSSN